MPKPGSKIEFKNIAKQVKVPYCIIADFYSHNEDFNQKKCEKTIKVAKQKPFAYGSQVCFSFCKTQNKSYKYFDEDASRHFVAAITEVCIKIANEYRNRQIDHGYTQE